MPPPKADSRSNVPKLPPSRQPQPSSRRRIPRRIQHSWSDEELNLLSYFRHNHRWTYSQIQKAYFPSLSAVALKRAHQRLTAEDRVHRASAAAALITTSHNTIGTFHDALDAYPTRSNLDQGPNCLQRPVSRPIPQSESNTETFTVFSPSCETEDRSITSNSCHTNRYNLRPNRPTIFRKRKPRYLVDRVRFPRFFKSYKIHLKLHAEPDEDYIPPSHSPTPDPSDRSPSVISNQPSEVSSLELFGLEARSLSPAERSPSIISIQSSDVSSLEPLSPEERFHSP
jgi:hypothetical protein